MSRLKSKQSRRGELLKKRSLALMGIFFLCFGGIMLYVFLGQTLLRVEDAKSWQEVSCVITESFLESSAGESTTYRPSVRYHFDLNGRQYEGNAYDFSGMYTSGYKSQLERLTAVPVGARVPCYVNLEDPTQSVIFRDLSWAIILPGLLVAIFPLVGLIVLYFALRADRKKSPGSGSSAQTGDYIAQASAMGSASLDKRIRGIAPVEAGVKIHRSSPWLKLFGSIFIALFWNGIVGIIAYNVVPEIMDGSSEWFLGLFLLPFVLVGIGLLGLVGAMVLSLSNPRILIEISPHPQALGEKINVKWTITGGSRTSLQSLRFSLEGKEFATYRRGTSTTTDSARFFQQDLKSYVGMEISMGQGRFDFVVPATMIPSLEVPNNVVRWSLHCRGEIPRWPDLTEEVSFTVLPLKR